jgi:hypothetical protein
LKQAPHCNVCPAVLDCADTSAPHSGQSKIISKSIIHSFQLAHNCYYDRISVAGFKQNIEQSPDFVQIRTRFSDKAYWNGDLQAGMDYDAFTCS